MTKLFKYLLTGGASFVVEFSVFLFLVYVVTLPGWAGQTISYVVALIINFALLKYWAFVHGKESGARRQLIKYGMLVGINLPLTTWIVYELISHNVEPFIAKLAVVLMAACWNYVIYDRLIFPQRKNLDDQS